MSLYIKAMSKSKKKIRSDIQNHALQVACNICKLTLFKSTEHDNHWKGETWSNLSSVKKLSKSDQFPSEDFIEQSFYSGFPDKFKDVIMFARSEEENLEVDTDFSHKKTFKECENVQPCVTLMVNQNIRALVSIDIHPSILKSSNNFPIQVLDDYTREYIAKLRKVLMKGWYKYTRFDDFEYKLYQKIYEH